MGTPLDFGVTLQVAENLPSDTVDALWKQGVDMDDWDYVVFGPPEIIERDEDEEQCRGYEPHWRAKEWTVGRLLTGCSDNTWYLVTLDGQEYALGVAYHA